MPYEASAPPPRLAELVEVLKGCRNAFIRIADEHHWNPTLSSTARADALALVGSGSPAGQLLIGEAVASYLELAAQHCGGLAGLYITGEVFASPDPLVRSILENCARAVWILGNNPSDAPVLDRLARAYIENDLSNEEEKKAAKYIAGETSLRHVEAKKAFTDLRTEIKNVFADTDFGHGRTINGQTSPKPTEAVLAYFELLETRGGSSITTTVAEGIYTLLCNATHPTLYTLRARRRPVPHTGHIGTTLHVDVDHLVQLTRLAVAAIFGAISWVHGYYGWPFDPDQELTNLIDKNLPGFFPPASTPEKHS